MAWNDTQTTVTISEFPWLLSRAHFTVSKKRQGLWGAAGLGPFSRTLSGLPDPWLPLTLPLQGLNSRLAYNSGSSCQQSVNFSPDCDLPRAETFSSLSMAELWFSSRCLMVTAFGLLTSQWWRQKIRMWGQGHVVKEMLKGNMGVWGAQRRGDCLSFLQWPKVATPGHTGSWRPIRMHLRMIITRFFFRAFSVPHILLNALCGISQLILLTVQIESFHYYHIFTRDKETEAQRSWMPWITYLVGHQDVELRWPSFSVSFPGK